MRSLRTTSKAFAKYKRDSNASLSALREEVTKVEDDAHDAHAAILRALHLIKGGSLNYGIQKLLEVLDEDDFEKLGYPVKMAPGSKAIAIHDIAVAIAKTAVAETTH